MIFMTRNAKAGIARGLRVLALASLSLAALLPLSAGAVPSMARQTNLECGACHTVAPELTPFGRQFKLRGYTLGQLEAKNSPVGNVPISFLLQGSRTSMRKTDTPGATPDQFEGDRDWVAQGAGLYYGGKITDNSGAMVQYFYNGIERKWMMEMFDMRYANSASVADKDVLFGFTLSNSPTVTDIYNSTSQWSFPHVDSAALEPNAKPLIDLSLASKVGGPGAYLLWNDLVYAEFALYRNTRTGVFRPLGWGENVLGAPLVSGVAPYWRLALQKEAGQQSFAAGVFGFSGNTFPDGEFSGGTDRFNTVGVDGQYQFISSPHIFTVQARAVRERRTFRESFREGDVGAERATLKTANLGLHYYFERRYGLRAKWFNQTGDADAVRFNTGAAVTGSINGSPNNRGWIAEAVFLPIQSLQISARYTAYTRFNGAGTNYDGFGRNARDNDSVFLLAWWLF